MSKVPQKLAHLVATGMSACLSADAYQQPSDTTVLWHRRVFITIGITMAGSTQTGKTSFDRDLEATSFHHRPL
jgi:hypothetical protein